MLWRVITTILIGLAMAYLVFETIVFVLMGWFVWVVACVLAVLALLSMLVAVWVSPG